MRIITPMVIITASLAYILGLLEPSMWAKAGRNLAIFISQLGFEESLLEEALAAAYETVLLSLVGVSLGTIIAYLASPLTTPAISSPRLSGVFRLIASGIRSIPAIFWAILFVILVGPGPRAGALALSIYTSAYLTKLFYESLESIPQEHIDTLRVIGLRGLSLSMALYTHIRRQVLSNILFMLEYNVRTATILGFVGAGGVGYYILHYVSLLNYPAVVTFIMVTTVFVILIDTISYILRTRLS